jgi:hypothetical protein
MFQRATEAVDFPDGDQVELAPMGISHEAVELRPALTRTRDTFIEVFGYDLPASPGTILPKLRKLHFRVLSVQRADSGVQCNPHASSNMTP